MRREGVRHGVGGAVELTEGHAPVTEHEGHPVGVGPGDPCQSPGRVGVHRGAV